MTLEQDNIIKSEKSLFVSSTAGSGKTHTLSGSVLYKIQEKFIPPEKIKIFSFSRNASSEVRNRLKESLSDSVYAKILISTIHAYGYKIIKSHKHDFGVSRIDIRDDGYYYSLIYNLIVEDQKAEGVPADEKRKKEMKELAVKAVNVITRMKSMNFPESHLDEKQKDYDYIKKLYFKVKAYMKSKGYFTFTDLLYYSIPFLKEHPELVKRYQMTMDYLYLDEAQDTARLQLDFLSLFLRPETQIFVFGDIKQTLYRFNYADPFYLLDWLKKNNIETTNLSKTFRYGKEVADISQRVVDRMEIPAEHKIYTDTLETKKSDIFHKVFNSSQEKVNYVCDEIQKNYEKGIPYHDMNILYRMNKMSLEFQYEFIKRRIPFYVSGSMFLLRTEVKFLLDLISICEYFDRESLAFITKTLSIGIDEGLVNILCDEFTLAYGRDPKNNEELMDFFAEHTIKGIGPTRQKSFNHLFAILTSVQRLLASNPKTIFKDLISITNLMNLPFVTKIEPSIWIIRSGFLAYMDTIKETGDFESIEDFVNYLKLGSLSEEEVAIENKVYLGSIHSSKGSTMPIVYLIIDELSYNTIPNPDAIDADIDQGKGNTLLDELFVLFVGLTRTRDEIHIISSNAGLDTSTDLLYTGFNIAKNTTGNNEMLSSKQLQYNLINMKQRLKIRDFHKVRHTDRAYQLRINNREYWIPNVALGSDGENLYIASWLVAKQGIML